MSSPNCGDKVEVQLLFMAFFIYICYMAARLRKIEANLDAYNLRSTTFLKEILHYHPDKEMEDLCYSSLSSPDSVITFDTEFPDNVIERIKRKIEIVKNQLSCLKTTKYRMDVIEKVQKHLEKMSKEIKNFTSSLPQVNGGRRRRKSRKKKGRGSCMSRKKKHISARQPKDKYLNKAIEELILDSKWRNSSTVVKVQRMRNLALELQDNDKKGGRKKRKSRRRTKKKRKSRRRKTKRRRR